jgi:hypothetical protein
MTLMDTLQQRLADGRPFGFCPAGDADEVLWGVALEVNEANFQVQLIGTLGESNEIEWHQFDSVTNFDFGDRYSERLSRLRQFNPSLPEDYEFVLDSVEIERILGEAVASGAVVQVEVLPDDATSTVRVLSIEGEWVTMRDYDDLMQPYGLLVHRLSNISGVRAGTAYEEADEFVERAGR